MIASTNADPFTDLGTRRGTLNLLNDLVLLVGLFGPVIFESDRFGELVAGYGKLQCITVGHAPPVIGFAHARVQLDRFFEIIFNIIQPFFGLATFFYQVYTCARPHGTRDPFYPGG